MSQNDPWQPFREVLDDPWTYAGSWKDKTGGKVIGHLLPDVPEEIIHAAGGLPVAVEGAGVNVTRAAEHIPAYTCNHAMGAVELRMRGDLDVLDGMVIPYVCDTTRNLFHVWNVCFPDIANEFLRLPKRVDHPGAKVYLKAELNRFAQSMGNITGRTPGTEELAASVSLYNESRARLRQAYACHQARPDVWTAQKLRWLLGSALRTPREQHLEWMKGLPWVAESGQEERALIRLYVRGKVWDPPEIMDMLDELGFVLARDELVTGFRSIYEASSMGGDPVDALVERHMSNVPYTGYHLEPGEIVEGFVRRVRESSSQGVLFLNPKFCEAAAFDTPDMRSALDKEGIPSLILETSARGAPAQQIRLRLEAFREMLSDDLP